MHKGIGTLVRCQRCLIGCTFRMQTCLHAFLCGLLLLLLVGTWTLHQGQIHRSPHSRSAPGLRFCDSPEFVWNMLEDVRRFFLFCFFGCWWPGHSAAWSHSESLKVTSRNPTISINIQQSLTITFHTFHVQGISGHLLRGWKTSRKASLRTRWASPNTKSEAWSCHELSWQSFFRSDLCNT